MDSQRYGGYWSTAVLRPPRNCSVCLAIAYYGIPAHKLVRRNSAAHSASSITYSRNRWHYCALQGSRRIRRPDARLAISAPFSRSTILALQVQPELCAVPEVTAEPHRGVGRDRAAVVENVSDAAGWNADIKRQPVGTEFAGHDLAFQQAAGSTIGAMFNLCDNLRFRPRGRGPCQI